MSVSRNGGRKGVGLRGVADCRYLWKFGAATARIQRYDGCSVEPGLVPGGAEGTEVDVTKVVLGFEEVVVVVVGETMVVLDVTPPGRHCE